MSRQECGTEEQGSAQLTRFVAGAMLIIGGCGSLPLFSARITL
jgi:hypothetical protein